MVWWQPSEKKQLTEGSILKSLTHLATPMLVGAILQNVQTLIDLFWVGRLGATAIAAVAMSGIILMMLMPMLMGLATGTLALVARAVGAERMDEASHAAAQSLMLALVLGLFSGLIGWHYSDDLFRLLAAPPEVTAIGGVFLRISLAGSATVFLLFIGNAALQGAGDAITPMVIMAVANLINIAFAPLFIFGWGPFPALGVAGAAWATLLAQAVAAGVSSRLLLSGRTCLHLRWSQWRPDLPLAWRILRIGIPGSGQMLSRSLMAAVLMRFVAGCGTAAVAAYGTGLRFHMILLMPTFALGGAAATLMGQNLGADKPDRAQKAAWLATAIACGVMAVAAMVLMLWAPTCIRFFNAEPEVVAIGARYLRIVSPFYVFAALGIVLTRALNGAGDSLAPLIITLVSLWGLQVPLAIWFARLWQPATHGIWWAIAIAMTVNGLLSAGWFATGRWKRQRI